MFRRLLLLATLGVALSGCYMVPLALVGPASSGFTTASIIQSGVSTTANYMVKKSTGKTIAQHAYEVINTTDIENTYFPRKQVNNLDYLKFKNFSKNKN